MSFRWPLDNFTISQGFGSNPDYYKQYGQIGHNGLDLAAPAGTPVYAADDGVVAFEGWGKSGASGFAGWMGDPAGICILINNVGSYSGYAHLTSTVINAGQSVSKGQLIGYVGATGAATGPHLHFEMLPLYPDFKNGYAGRINVMPFVETEGHATRAQVITAYKEILERDPTGVDEAGISHYTQYPIDFVRQDLANSQEKRQLDANKAEAARQAAAQAAAEAAQAVADAQKASEAKAAQEAAQKAAQAAAAAEADKARIAEEERIAREAAEQKAHQQLEIEQEAKEVNMTTAIEQQGKVQEIADEVAGSEVVQDLVSGVSRRTKFTVYIIGDTLIGLGLVTPPLAIVINWTDIVQVVALSSLLATAGAFVLTMFGIYKAGRNK